MTESFRSRTLKLTKSHGNRSKHTRDEVAIRELIDGFIKAIRAKDIKKVMSVFSSEVVSFDIGPPLQHGGGEELNDNYMSFLSKNLVLFKLPQR
jgi:ketosteroid isomerase-like protein